MYENCIFAHKEVEDFYIDNNILKGMLFTESDSCTCVQ